MVVGLKSKRLRTGRVVVQPDSLWGIALGEVVAQHDSLWGIALGEYE